MSSLEITFDELVRSSEQLSRWINILPLKYKSIIIELIKYVREKYNHLFPELRGDISYIEVEDDLYNISFQFYSDDSVNEGSINFHSFFELQERKIELELSSFVDSKIGLDSEQRGIHILQKVYLDLEDENLVYINMYLPFETQFGTHRFDSEMLDRLSTSNDWDMEPVDRSFNPDLVNYYLRSLNSIPDPKERFVAETIIDQTQYVTFDQLKQNLIVSLDSLPDKVNLYFDTTDKIGSEHWLAVLIWPYLKEKVVNVFNSASDLVRSNSDLPIVLLDDCLYSGQHMMDTIINLSWNYNYSKDPTYCSNQSNWVNVHGDVKRTVRNKYLSNKIIIVVPYINTGALHGYMPSFANSLNVDLDIIYVQQIVPFMTTLNRTSHHQYSFPFGKDLIDYMQEHFQTMDINIPIYFDHKIAGAHSSFPKIYPLVIKEQPSRYKIEELSEIIESISLELDTRQLYE